MDSRLERIREVIAAVKAQQDEQTTIIEQLRATVQERDSLIAKWQALAEMTLWTELSSGANIAEGDKVRHLFKTYVCIKAHTKALIRSPINKEYWIEEASD